MDIKDQWMGVKRLKTDYRPIPYQKKTKEGRHVGKADMAEESAKK